MERMLPNCKFCIVGNLMSNSVFIYYFSVDQLAFGYLQCLLGTVGVSQLHIQSQLPYNEKLVKTQRSDIMCLYLLLSSGIYSILHLMTIENTHVSKLCVFTYCLLWYLCDLYYCEISILKKKSR